MGRQLEEVRVEEQVEGLDHCELRWIRERLHPRDQHQSFLCIANRQKELGDIVRVKGGRLSGKSRWEISVTYGPIQFFDFSDPNRETYR